MKEKAPSKRLYLQKAKLKGYKSILNVEIDFVSGLNIIIGKNAAGKTNFLNFLSKNLSLSFDKFIEFEANLTFQRNENQRLELMIKGGVDEDNLQSERIITPSKIRASIRIDGKEQKEDLSAEDKLWRYKDNELKFTSSFICHGVPKDYLIIDNPFGFTIKKKGGGGEDFIERIFSDEEPYFVKSLLGNLLFAFFRLRDNKNIDVNLVEDTISKLHPSVSNLVPHLRKFSPIQDVRFNENLNIFITDDSDMTVKNLFLEFKVDDNWHPFSNLSDGTKRLFYIISEVAFADKFIFGNRSLGVHDEETSKIILIEEPELGVHPHQLHQLMIFLKEQSEKKQIIITTHSPQALDILDSNELDQIIIAYQEKNSGTILRHLSKEENQKAQKYMSEEFLSDYWRFSDLESI